MKEPGSPEATKIAAPPRLVQSTLAAAPRMFGQVLPTTLSAV